VLDSEQVVRDEGDWYLANYGRGRHLPPKAPLKGREWPRAAAVVQIDRNQLSVKNESGTESAKRGDHFGIPARDVVERA
jgi:hypothetical protein